MSWVAPLLPGNGPRYLQIVTMMEQAIGDGALRLGERLPPQRKLAEALGVDLTTVTRAYDEARRRQLLEARGQQGTYVKGAETALTNWVNLSLNVPPVPSNIDLPAMLQKGLSSVAARADINQLLSYRLGGGSPEEKRAAARWLSPMLGAIEAGRVVVCPGAQLALATIILCQSARGDVVLTEPLVYPGLRKAVQQLEREIVPVPTDDAGMLPDALELACREQNAKLIYLNPTLQNPSTRTMTAQRRLEVAAVAARCGAMIIEDDPYWLFEDGAPTPIASTSPENVFYVSTLSKCLTPGLRTAFIVLPSAAMEDRFLSVMSTFMLMPMPLSTALVSLWIQDGTAQTLLSAVVSEAEARQELAGQILPGKQANHQATGIHIWRELPDCWNPRALARATREESIEITPADAFYVGGGKVENAIRISLGGGRDRRELAVALRNLSNLLDREPVVRTEIIV